jgi:hypothetical protein
VADSGITPSISSRVWVGCGYGLRRQACLAQHAKTTGSGDSGHRCSASSCRHRYKALARDQSAQSDQLQCFGLLKIVEVDQQRGAGKYRRRLRHLGSEASVDRGRIGTQRLQD